MLIDDKGRAKLNVTSELQIFGLIITAEPYFAVRQPSDVIVLENELREDTKGRVHFIESKTELLQRGQVQAAVESAGIESRSEERAARNLRSAQRHRDRQVVARG